MIEKMQDQGLEIELISLSSNTPPKKQNIDWFMPVIKRIKNTKSINYQHIMKLPGQGHDFLILVT